MGTSIIRYENYRLSTSLVEQLDNKLLNNPWFARPALNQGTCVRVASLGTINSTLIRVLHFEDLIVVVNCMFLQTIYFSLLLLI